MTNLRSQYESRYNDFLTLVASQLEDMIKEYFSDFVRIDRIVVRAKAVDSFIKKANKEKNGVPRYSDPLNQIQDQIGARIVTFYKDDVGRVNDEILKYFRHIEEKDMTPESESEFGYFGKHYILLLPTDITNSISTDAPKFFELQVKTLFQHSWSEANHDLAYKATDRLSSEFKRKIAFTSAQAWGADEIFNDLFKYISQKTD